MTNDILKGVLLNNEYTLTLVELSNACLVQESWIIELVDEAILEPMGENQSSWLFTGKCLQRSRKVKRLALDLGVNIAGAALILELIDENEQLRTRLTTFEKE